jgi:hypothetical protein
VPDRCVIFIHIPKTAGVTLSTALRFQYPTGMLSFTTLDKPINEFQCVPLSERKLAKVVMGHVHYGLHNYIPKECMYVTILREPVSRVLSLYKFILREPKHPLHKHVSDTNVGLEDFIASRIDKKQTENGQTRQICGLQTEDPDRAALEAAKENLEKFAGVGLMESFDESLMLLRRSLDWRMPPFYLSRNVSPRSRPSVESERALNLIREHNELDLELYEFAYRLFADRIHEQGQSFARQLTIFKMLNKFPDTLGRGAGRVARRVLQWQVARKLRGEY